MATLAIDQGTTTTRALLLDDSGTGRIVKSLAHQQILPQPGWVEHDPEELIRNIQECLDCGYEITAVGIDNQGESCLAWDADSKEAICPVIVWQDNRTQPVIARLQSQQAQSLVMAKTGLPLDSYFSASKLAWIVEHIPAAGRLLRTGKLRLGTTDAFFLDRLTGHFVTDITTASRTSLMDLTTGQWDDELCRLFGVPRQALPEIVPCTGDFGSLQNNGQALPVTASIVDQQAALYGHGCRHPGDAKITFGTGAFALVLTGEQPFQAPEQGLLPTVAWQFQGARPVYALDGGVYSAGSAVNWAQSLGLFERYEQIAQFTRPSAIDRNLVFVPALAGLGCPHWDRKAGGLWLGLALDTQPMDLMQSILEGIACRAAEVIMGMNRFTAIQNDVSIDGGLSANPYFCQFLADLLERTVSVPADQELTALGTARLAAGQDSATGPGNPAAQQYRPQTDRRPALAKFQEAVARSSRWYP